MPCKYLKGLAICAHPDIEVGEFGPHMTIGSYSKCPVEFGAHVCGLYEDDIFRKGAIVDKETLMR